MEIIELASGERKSVIITRTLKNDLKSLTEDRFFFNWRTLEGGDIACVSLVPKTEIRHHCIEKYGMQDAGWQLFLDGWRLLNIVKKYVLCM